MNKTALKIFSCFASTAAVISILLLIINFLAFAFISSDTANIYKYSPKYTLDKIADNFTKHDNMYFLEEENLIEENCWCILIDKNGDIVWEQGKPDDIQNHYTINDIANMTRWFLNDYPVYVRSIEHGLLVLGTPKNSVGKYNIEYSMSWFSTLPQRGIIILFINLLIAFILAFTIGIRLYKKLKSLTIGINDLRCEKQVTLREKGLFKEIYANINETSNAIIRKNKALAIRDNARVNWIAGISHDLRTPLSMIMGYSESFSNSSTISEENRKQAKMITNQSVKMKKLIDDLNLISSLEYDMQPSKKKAVKLCPLVRKIVADILNNGLLDKYEINIDFEYEGAVILGDEALLERAIFNLVNNSITHNKNGCIITISEFKQGDTIYIKISDNGNGVPAEVIKNISVMPNKAHGLGLPMAYKIFAVHGGKMTIENENGTCITITLSLNN